jgi:hypothetical protein
VFLGSRFKGYDIVACWSQELIRGYRIDRIFVDDPEEHMSKLVGSAGL